MLTIAVAGLMTVLLGFISCPPMTTHDTSARLSSVIPNGSCLGHRNTCAALVQVGALVRFVAFG
jgi:hypothetical protein